MFGYSRYAQSFNGISTPFQTRGHCTIIGPNGLLLLGLGLLLCLLLGLLLLAPVFFLLTFLSFLVLACPTHRAKRRPFVLIAINNISHYRAADRSA